MMVLRAVQIIEAPPEDVHTSGGAVVPIIGKTTKKMTRAWFQCLGCGLIGCIDGLMSPMMPPPCGHGCGEPKGEQ